MKGGSFKGKTRRISSYIKPTMKKTKKSKPRNTSGGKSNKPPVYNPARGTYRTRLKKEEETDRYAKYYNKKMEPQEDYTEKFSGMRIDDSRNYHEKRTEYICEPYNQKRDNDNHNYYLQAQEKARISPNFDLETEHMGTIATERASSRKGPMNEVYEVPPNIHSRHRRKQSANIPYKMSMPHTNIEKLSGGDRSDLNYQQINCQFLNTDDMNDEDEECNIGDEAEEAPECYYNNNFKQPKANKGNIRIGGHDRNFRSNTTKSGSSSRGHYKQTDVMNHHGISTQDDDDNFLSLECDENLYEEDRLNYNLEEEKVVIHPTKGKQGLVKFKSSKDYQNHKPMLNNPVDDTIPDFGYMSNHRENNVTGKLKDNKVILNKDQPELRARKIPKVIKNYKNNENSDPFISLTMNPEEESPAKHGNKAQEDEEFSRRISSIAEQYDFNYGFEEIDQNPEFRDDDFLFSQIDCDEELQSKSKSSEKNKSGSMEYDDYKYQEYSNMIKPPRIDTDPIPTMRESKTGDLSKKTSMPNLEEQRSLAASKLLNYLISIEGVYAPDPSYSQNNQPEISSIMRAILLDWMMEVCNEFTLKRETYYYSVNYVDRFLSNHHHVKKEELQLVGVTSMFIAAKMEEVYSPRVADFAKSTDNGYEVEQIVAMEKLMLKELGWYMTPPTYSMWANWYMNQWDIFINENEYAMSHIVIQNCPDLTFKSSNESSYARFREVMQIMDLIILDQNCLLYQPRGLVVSIMFLILGVHTGEFNIQKVCNEFTYSSNGFLDMESEFNQLFIEFIYLSFGFQLHDLAPTIQYVAPFMNIPFNYDMPMCCQNKNALEGHFEEFLSYQTHHPMGLKFIEQKINNSQSY